MFHYIILLPVQSNIIRIFRVIETLLNMEPKDVTPTPGDNIPDTIGDNDVTPTPKSSGRIPRLSPRCWNVAPANDGAFTLDPNGSKLLMRRRLLQRQRQAAQKAKESQSG